MTTPENSQASAFEIWIGAYGAKDEVTLTRLQLFSDTAELVKAAEYAGIEDASFLRMNRSGTRLYAVSETLETDGEEGGQLASFPIEPDTLKLGPVQFHRTYGAHPCHLSLAPEEDWLAVSNYNGASVTLFMITPDSRPSPAVIRLCHTGSGPNEQRQEAPHPHAAVFSPDGNYMFVPDLGLDRVMVYARGPEANEWSGHEAISMAPGDGPRHFAFHPSGRAAFVVNELSCTVTRFTYDEKEGALGRQESITTLPSSFKGDNTCAEIVVSPDGRFVYASNRGHDSIAIFRIDDATGRIEAAGHVSTRGSNPRNFALTPDGCWLIAANQDSDNVVLYRIEPNSGLPIFAGTEIAVRKPVCVLIREART
ncbi:lactonase family protein [Cohnella faecalis]|uniref:Lactonase family protein n=1 Tax=Cohnella faecalis TaxID=2315694 RepID=A0A398CDV7_9BACL|nr:lactonase family protein [Cohnella faecalis]RIE01366.1 lactonase family protein [Cohnella faecalis]